MTEHSGPRVLVTGASSGLGLAMARVLTVDDERIVTTEFTEWLAAR
jgi:NAD(P)-dependent dehydrogenase (short-subunit alcohol dehydrogenase family)